MEASENANFINAVASGQVVPCPNCDTANEKGSKFCISCGAQLPDVKENGATPAFATISEETDTAENNQELVSVSEVAATAAFASVEENVGNAVEEETAAAFAPAFEEEKQSAVVPEEVSIFAEGLPDWDIVPPQTMVRRR